MEPKSDPVLAARDAGGVRCNQASSWDRTVKVWDSSTLDHGKLPFQGIIHVAGINHAWRSSEYSIRESVRNALEIASQAGYQSVAIPAIGAGSGGIWGVGEERSLAIIREEASRSSFAGLVVIVKYKREA